jgi:hypothetical protein
MGDRGGRSSTTASFTIPSEPVRRRVTGLPQFVHVAAAHTSSCPVPSVEVSQSLAD